MWLISTYNGGIVSESDVLWPDLPKDIVIRQLRYRSEKMSDFDAYGFQRFAVNTAVGQVGAGIQLIGVKGDTATIVELNEITGERRQWTVPRAELTYAPELLRNGQR